MAILLTLHVVSAVLALISAIGVVWATYKKQAKTADRCITRMWLVTALTSLSGVLLMVVTGAIGRTCVSMFVFLSVVAFAHGYKKLAKPAYQTTRR